MVLYACYAIILVHRGSYNELTRYIGLNVLFSYNFNYSWKSSICVKFAEHVLVK